MPRLTTDTILRATAALASAGAGIIHLAVAKDHMESWWLSGTFFIVLGVVQLAWGPLAMWSATPLILGAGVLVNVGAVVLWAITRSPIGQPAGPLAGQQLPIGPAGVLSSVLEVVVVGSLVAASTISAPKRIGAVVPLALVALVVAGLTGPGVTAALAHDHAGHVETGSAEHDEHSPTSEHHDSPAPGEESSAPGSGAKTHAPSDTMSPSSKPGGGKSNSHDDEDPHGH